LDNTILTVVVVVEVSVTELVCVSVTVSGVETVVSSTVVVTSTVLVAVVWTVKLAVGVLTMREQADEMSPSSRL
jgi:hypothetical protein